MEKYKLNQDKVEVFLAVYTVDQRASTKLMKGYSSCRCLSCRSCVGGPCQCQCILCRGHIALLKRIAIAEKEALFADALAA